MSTRIDDLAQANTADRELERTRSAFAHECDDADQLLRLLELDPGRCRTDGGSINLPKVRAFLASHLKPAPQHAVPLASSRVGRVYLAGPMTGIEDYNFPAFNAYAAKLRASGLHVENPAEHGVVEGAEWADYLRYDMQCLATCETIALMPRWSRSRGAALEHQIATALGMRIQLLDGAEAPQFEAAKPVQRVYLVATGEVHEGQETYTRHDARPPLCDAEVLLSAPSAQEPAAPVFNLDALEQAMRLADMHAGDVAMGYGKGRGHRNVLRAHLVRYLATPPPAAHAVEALLPDDLADLKRLDDLFEDGEGWDLSKARMQRLAEIGVIRRAGSSYYAITSFGRHCLERADFPFPLRTAEEYNEQSRQQAAAVASKAQP